MGNKATPLPHPKGSVRGSLLFFVILHLTRIFLRKPRDLLQSAALCGPGGFESYRMIDKSICVHTDPAFAALSIIPERTIMRQRLYMRGAYLLPAVEAVVISWIVS